MEKVSVKLNGQFLTAVNCQKSASAMSPESVSELLKNGWTLWTAGLDTINHYCRSTSTVHRLSSDCPTWTVKPEWRDQIQDARSPRVTAAATSRATKLFPIPEGPVNRVTTPHRPLGLARGPPKNSIKQSQLCEMTLPLSSKRLEDTAPSLPMR